MSVTTSPQLVRMVLDSMSADVRRDYERLSSDEREFFLNAFSQPEIINDVYKIDYKEIPVSPYEFLTDPYFLGKDLVWDEKEHRGIYPKWVEELCFVLDPRNEVWEWILSGSLGIGKSTVAFVSQIYYIYWLNCLKDPHSYLGMLPSSPIELFLFSITLTTVEDAGVARFERLINNSPYFRENFPVNRRRRSKGTRKGDLFDYKLEFPPFLEITEGSKETHFISRDILGGVLDEANFVPQPKKSGALSYDNTSRAFSLYQSLRNRIESRFMKQGKVFGLLCLISSAATRFDFLEQHKKKQRNNPHVRISEFPIYDMKPWEYCGKKFFVLIGNEHSNSKILKEDEKVVLANDSTERIIEVPIEHRAAFERDLPRALREISGIPSEVISPLIPIRESIRQTIDPKRKHPFKLESPVLGHLNKLIKLSDFVIPEMFVKWSGSTLTPINYPNVSRYIHVDLSQSQCATGMTMGCTPHTVDTKIMGPDGREMTAKAPMVFIDFYLQITPPGAPEEISYAAIRQFIKYLRDVFHFRIKLVTFDGFQCVSSNTKIWTDKGFVLAKNIEIGDIVQSRIGPKPITKVWSFGKQKILKLTTDDGHILEMTEDHKIEASVEMKLEKLGRRKKGGRGESTRSRPVWGWVRAKDLVPGMKVRAWDQKSSVGPTKYIDLLRPDVPAKGKYNKGVHFPLILNEDFAEWLGVVWSDGNIMEDHIGIATHEDGLETTIEVWGRVAHKEVVGIQQDTEFGYQTRVNCRGLYRFLKNNNLIKSYDFIPEPILRSPIAVQAAFIRGLFTGDGSVNSRDGKVTFSTTAPVWANYVQDFLRSAFGIESCITVSEKYLNGKRCKNTHTVGIRGPRAEFLENIGFLPGKKLELLKKFSGIKGERRWTRVKSIEFGEAEVFDFEVQDDHSYVANGLVSHNSVDSKQILQNEGFESEVLSMDRTPDPYLTMKSAIIENRITRYEYPLLETELCNLQLVYEGNKIYIEKPQNGSKDISDSFAAVVYHCHEEVRQLIGEDVMKSVLGSQNNPKKLFLPIGR